MENSSRPAEPHPPGRSPGRLALTLTLLGALSAGCDGKPAKTPDGAVNGASSADTATPVTGTAAASQPPRPAGSDTVQRRVEPKAMAMIEKYLSLLDSAANAGVKEMAGDAVLDIGFRDASPTLETRWTPRGVSFRVRMPQLYEEMMPPERMAPVTRQIVRLVGERFVGAAVTSLLPDLEDYEILYREADGRPFVKLFAARPGPVWERLEIRFDDAGLVSTMFGTTRSDKDDPLASAYGGACDVTINVTHAARGGLWVLSEMRIAANAAQWDAKLTWFAGTTRPALVSEIRYTTSHVTGDRAATFPEWVVDGRKHTAKPGGPDAVPSKDPERK